MAPSREVPRTGRPAALSVTIQDEPRSSRQAMASARPSGPPRKPERPDRCELCGRAVPLTFHHLVPRGVHRRTRFIRRHGKDKMRSSGLWVCRLCHSGIHAIIPNERELAESYSTKERLLGHEGIARHVAWVSRQKPRRDE